MIESDFRKSLSEGMRAQGAFVYKLPDLNIGALKPFDLLVAYEYQFYPMELKLKKLLRKRPLHEDDVVVHRQQFRGHQLPMLREIRDRHWGHAYVAACLARVEETRIVDKQAWIIPMTVFDLQLNWTPRLLRLVPAASELQWVPGLGWTVPWLPKVER